MKRVIPVLIFLLALYMVLMSIGVFGQDESKYEFISKNLPENSQACGDCHDEIYGRFMRNQHARLGSFELHGAKAGCEMCHGDGTKHIDSNEPKDIITFKGMKAREINSICTRCHRGEEFSGWMHTAHAKNGLSCIDCHDIHKGDGAPPKDELKLCGKCHRDVVSKMYLPSHHPVREGKMECTDCHNIHGTEGNGSLRTSERKNDLCFKCHSKYQGPFVFEHAPVEEDCTICHDVHGTAANNLLKENEPFLCLQCHTSHFHMGRVAETTPDPEGYTTGRNGAMGFKMAFGTKCTQCHSHIHGSDLPSQSVPGRGKALTR